MKKLRILMLICVAMSLSSGCAFRGNSAVRTVVLDKITEQPETTSEKKIQEETIPENTTQEESEQENITQEETTPENTAREDAEQEETTAIGNEAGDVDYDLTVMKGDMLYATISQMMMYPEMYEGKTFRIRGAYYSGYYEATEKYYHYCLIEDASACCAQWMEFVWDDGSHKYPDEYPELYDYITIEGRFETYTEDGEKVMYCRIADASMQIESTQ